MRTASLVLGIVGGVLAIIFSFIAFGTAAALDIGSSYLGGDMDEYMDDFSDALEDYESGDFDFDYDFNSDYDYEWDYAATAVSGTATYFYIAGALGIVGGILGIIGGAIVKKKNVLAGIFLIVACVLASLSLWGIIAGIVLLIGGILALVKDKRAQMAAAGYEYPPYQPSPYEQGGAYNPYQQQAPQAPPQYNPYQQQAPQAPPQYNPYQQAPQAPPQYN
ncbi:MAG: DUF4064 domain-containing protein, partial [Bacillota bacterium]